MDRTALVSRLALLLLLGGPAPVAGESSHSPGEVLVRHGLGAHGIGSADPRPTVRSSSISLNSR